MRVSRRQALERSMPLVDIVIAPVVYVCALILKLVRVAGVQRLPHSKGMLLRAGCFPLRDHYYEPAFDNEPMRMLLSAERELPGIDWSGDEQLRLLESFTYSGELTELPRRDAGGYGFYLENRAFESGDAEYWYNIIRVKKPRRIIEIGSGFSTRMAIRALEANKRDDPQYTCEHILIEPYEHQWLESLECNVIREKVENADIGMFKKLRANDILFIDSSHVIRPRGDVLTEYLGILPILDVGVIVHTHDIFSPRDYPADLVVDKVRFWNEQYLLEAFLTLNHDWKIIGALNFLRHNHFDELRAKCPFLTEDREPGSFYIQRVHASA